MFQVLLFAANKKRELNESLQSCLCALCTIYQFLHKFPEKVGLKETEAEKKKTASTNWDQYKSKTSHFKRQLRMQTHACSEWRKKKHIIHWSICLFYWVACRNWLHRRHNHCWQQTTTTKLLGSLIRIPIFSLNVSNWCFDVLSILILIRQLNRLISTV